MNKTLLVALIVFLTLVLVVLLGLLVFELSQQESQSSNQDGKANTPVTTARTTSIQKSSSSGKICTYMRPLGNNPDQIRYAIAASDMNCPYGETCTKASYDLDGDGLLCTTIQATDGVLQVCDGVCK